MKVQSLSGTYNQYIFLQLSHSQLHKVKIKKFTQ